MNKTNHKSKLWFYIIFTHYYSVSSDDVPVPPGGPFVLCEYGAADGGASHDLIANLIGEEDHNKTGSND